MLFVLMLFKILLKILLLLCVFMIILFIIPFKYDLNFDIENGIYFSFKVRWTNFLSLTGLLNKEEKEFGIFLFNKALKLPNFKRRKSNRNKDVQFKDNTIEYIKEKEGERKEKFSKQSGIKKLKDIIDKDFINATIDFLKSIIIVLKPQRLYIKIIYGCFDPYITGIISGFIYHMDSFIPSDSLMIEPCFDDEIFELNSEIAGEISIGSLIIKTSSYILNKNVRCKIKVLKTWNFIKKTSVLISEKQINEILGSNKHFII